MNVVTKVTVVSGQNDNSLLHVTMSFGSEYQPGSI